MTANAPQPRIVRKKKVSGDGHHGGAWKVAYADFVTAMMAFFLLMWLLGATNEKQRKGIADYFNPTVPINKISGGGEGAFGGDTVFSESTLTKQGSGAGMLRPTESNAARGSTGVDAADSEDEAAEEVRKLSEIAEAFSGLSGESMVSETLRRHIISKLTDEGLVVELFALPDAPLFERDGAATPLLEDLLIAVEEVFRLVENPVAIRGHVAMRPLVVQGADPWQLAATHADTTRRVLKITGFPAQRMRRVTSAGDSTPAVADPLATRNNRVEVVLLRNRI